MKRTLTKMLQHHLPSCSRLATPATRSIHTDSHSSPSSLNCRAKLADGNHANNNNNNNNAHIYSNGQLVTPIGKSELYHGQKSAPLNWSIKRKADPQSNEQPFKIPKIMNKPMTSNTSQPSLTSWSASCTSQSSANNVVSEIWKRNSLANSTNSIQSSPMVASNEMQGNTVKSNMPRAVQKENGNSKHPFPVLPITNHNGCCDSTAVTSVSCIRIDGNTTATATTSRAMHYNGTDKQKIDQIKKHLLDGFPTFHTSPQCIQTTYAVV